MTGVQTCALPIYYGTSNAFEIFDDNRSALIVAKGGNVGINTYYPTYDLQVIGDANVSELFRTSNLEVYGDDMTVQTRILSSNFIKISNDSKHPALKVRNYGTSNAFEIFDDNRSALIVAKGGNVGINTYYPTYDLQVIGDANVSELFRTSNLEVYGDDMTVQTRILSSNFIKVSNSSKHPALKVTNYGTSNAFEIFDDNRAAMIITKGGNVGINTYYPTYDLQVIGDANVSELFRTSNLEVYGDDMTVQTRLLSSNFVKISNSSKHPALKVNNYGTSNAFEVLTSNVPRLVVDNKGYIGINKYQPDYELDVEGNLRVSKTLYSSNIVIYGETTTLNTQTYQSEKMEIVSQSQGPALTVKQIGVDDMFHVYDDNDIVFVINNQRRVGVNKINPDTDFDVNGTVKATYFSGDGQSLRNVYFQDRTTTLLAEGSNLYYTSDRVGVIAYASNIHASNMVYNISNVLDQNLSNLYRNTISQRFANLYTDTSNLYNNTTVNEIRNSYVNHSNLVRNISNLLDNNFSNLYKNTDRKSTRLNSSHMSESRMPSSA